MSDQPAQFVTVTPEPTDEEMAVILATFGELWPEPLPVVERKEDTRWRFSGRWWAQQQAGFRQPPSGWS